MSGYTKLFSTILASTIWQESKETKIIWITMLAAANKDGVVEASVPGLAHMAKLTIQETEQSLGVLMSPDPYSRTPAFEGRRIEKCDGGWQILNHDKYREQMSAAERAEYNKLKQRESRARRQARTQGTVNDLSIGVSNVNDLSACQRQAEAHTKAESVYLRGTGESHPLVHRAEQIVRSYPRKGGDHFAPVIALLRDVDAGGDIEFIATCVSRHSECYKALPASEKRHCPGTQKYFEGRYWESDPEASPWTYHPELPRKPLSSMEQIEIHSEKV